MAKDIEKLLESIGLLPSESKIYLSALQTGSETVQNIAKAAGISRTATYDAIESLKQRGLMTTMQKGKKMFYAAEDPDRLVSYLKEEQQRLDSKISEVMHSVDALRMIAGGSRPKVRVYEGKEALFAFFSLLEQSKPKELLEVTNVDDVYNHIDEKTLLAARKAYKWTVKKLRILHKGELRNPRKGSEFRELSKEWGEFHGNFSVFGDYVVFASYIGTMTIVVLESELFANSMRTFFNLAWSAAGRKKTT
jgi:sugar-specific transcriptional regulator TrmB